MHQGFQTFGRSAEPVRGAVFREQIWLKREKNFSLRSHRVILFVGTTGQWGSTIGKRLCGIRIVRTTLRPCGFARALLREILLWLDTPLLLTPLPGVFTILVTDNRQRIGDLLADTIAIQTSNTPVGRERETNEKGLGTLIERLRLQGLAGL